MALSSSHSYISREAKLKRLIAAEAMRIAKEKNDPAYKRARKYKQLWKKMVKQIVRKYKGMATQRVRAKIAQKQLEKKKEQ